MADLAWFPFYVDRFLSSRRTRTMTAEQVGIYLLLLCEQWDKGAVPDVPAEIEDITRADRSQAEAVLQRCFTLTEHGWQNDAMEDIRAEQEAKSARLAEAGRRGGVKSGRVRRSKPGSSQAKPGLERSQAQARLKPGSSIRREESREEEITTSNEQTDVDNSVARLHAIAEDLLSPPPEQPPTRDLTVSGLEELAATRLGLGILPPLDLRTNASILKTWAYGSGRSLEEIEAAIEGLADMVVKRRAEVTDWLPPGKPITLKALNNTNTLYDQGDGKAQRPLWDVAVECYRAQGIPAGHRAPRGTGLARASA